MSRNANRGKDIKIEALPIDPLSDLSWQRIERHVFAELAEGERDRAREAAAVRAMPAMRSAGSRRGRRLALAAVGVTLAAAAALVVAVWPSGQPGSPTHQADLGRTPSRIATGDSPSAVSLGDVALDVAPRSAVLVDDGHDRGVLIVLERGRVACRVAPRNGRPPVVVNAGDVRVEVVGTEFAVSRTGDSAEVEVYHGVVKVVQHGRVSRVAAGHSWSGLSHESDRQGPLAAGDQATQTSRDHDAATPAGSAATVTQHRHRPSRAAGHPGHPQRATQAADRSSAPPPESDRVRYDEAARLEASDPAASLALYRELVASGGAWAANALFAEGRLELDLGHTAGAQRLLQSYLRRYPRGPNAQDAHALLDRIQSRPAH